MAISNASRLADFGSGIGTAGAVIQVDNANQRVGIGTTNPQATLQVGTGVTIYGNSGIVSATAFYGDGSNLVNAGSSLAASSGTQRLVLTSLTSGTMTSAATDADLSWNSTTNTLSATNVSVAGTLTYEDVTNVDSVGLITARSGIQIGNVSIASTLGTDGGAVFSGIVTASSYRGDGSQLTGISAGIGTEALIASGITTTLDLSKQDHKVTATGITTITVSGGTEGDSHTVRIVNSGIATVGFSTYFLFPSGSPPSLPTASGAISIVSFTVHRVGTAGTQLLAGASLNFS